MGEYGFGGEIYSLINTLITIFLGGGWFLHWRASKRKANGEAKQVEADAFKSMQDAYQQMHDDLLKRLDEVCGERWNGRNVNLVGAHCEGYNANSIGVCYVGGCDKNMKAKDTRTDKQKAALIALLKDLRKLYPKAKIVSHRDLDRKGKACPSFDATNEYKNI